MSFDDTWPLHTAPEVLQSSILISNLRRSILHFKFDFDICTCKNEFGIEFTFVNSNTVCSQQGKNSNIHKPKSDQKLIDICWVLLCNTFCSEIQWAFKTNSKKNQWPFSTMKRKIIPPSFVYNFKGNLHNSSDCISLFSVTFMSRQGVKRPKKFSISLWGLLDG